MSTTGITCPTPACMLPSRRQWVPPLGHRLVYSHLADRGCHHHGHRHYVPATGLNPLVSPTVGATITATGIMCLPPACILPSRRQRVPPSGPPALCVRHQLVSSFPANSGCHHHGHQHCVPATDPLRPADNRCSHLHHCITCPPESVSVCLCYKYCTFGQLNAFC